MKAASGTIHRRVVVAHRFAFPVTMNGGCAFGGAEAHAFDSKWLEEMLLNRFFPCHIEKFLNDRAGDDIAKVRIQKSFAWFFG